MKTNRRRALVKIFILLALAGISIGLVEFSSIKEYLKPDRFQKMVSEAGLMGPALLTMLSAVGTCLFIPGTVFVGIGVAIFGPYLGFVCVWPGVLAGAAISYLVARRLGRELVRSLIGDRLRRYDDLIERNGFRAILLLRLMFVPFAPLNYGAGLTTVRFRDYFFATALGEAITIFVITFFIGEMREVWISGDMSRFFSAKMALSLGSLAAVVVVAKLAQRKYGKRPAQTKASSEGGARRMNTALANPSEKMTDSEAKRL